MLSLGLRPAYRPFLWGNTIMEDWCPQKWQNTIAQPVFPGISQLKDLRLS